MCIRDSGIHLHIAHPYKLFASKYVRNVLGLSGLYVDIYVLLAIECFLILTDNPLVPRSQKKCIYQYQ